MFASGKFHVQRRPEKTDRILKSIVYCFTATKIKIEVTTHLHVY